MGSHRVRHDLAQIPQDATRLCVCSVVSDSLQSPLSMELSRQEHWRVLPFPVSEGLPNPGLEPVSPASPALQVDSLQLSHRGSPASVVSVQYTGEYSYGDKNIHIFILFLTRIRV